ncbi:gamma-glutamylcyclotransferase family protein [Chitinolyticbacter meiyuanensis]|uniref:gamma-glutamylcyclotransferase family protein n=1 Tax=Chitinolyticbacter meiyuanensis TaxID=682798 RepID=UPI0011E59195|nr:gamma-glutamylcyclotransferase family protein [Chitinolyticbacter meiyuanensis]
MQSQLVFVYGTLKRGGWNHRWLDGATCLGEAQTVALFSLYAHQYPFLVREPRYPVLGELYAIDDSTLSNLDTLEGHPDDYRREQIPVRDGHGTLHLVWAYLHSSPQGGLLANGCFIETDR